MFEGHGNSKIVTRQSRIRNEIDRFHRKTMTQGYTKTFEGMNEVTARSVFLNFFVMPLKYMFAICLCPFYLKTISTQENGTATKTIKVKSWLPQKLVCAALIILDFSWMIKFVGNSLSLDFRNPAYHIDMMISVRKQLYTDG